ncbi:MAG: C40 family peptidase [Ruminococcus sp.]|nr:C40 family peptidase [Ruminococcus sp.]
MKNHLSLILAAALLLAGCGSSDSSEAPSRAADSASEAASQPEKAEFSEGFYRVARGAAMADGAHDVLSNSEDRVCYGRPDGNGALSIEIPFSTGVNELNEAQYEYRTFTVSDPSSLTALTADEVRQIVVDYALEMSGKPNQTYELSGEYVGETETRSDCSGMTELAYLQVGIYLEHYADAQANDPRCEVVFDNISYLGEISGIETYRVNDPSARVDISKLEKGDLLFFLCATNSSGNNSLYADDGIGHVAMYIGDGQMVHFTADYGLTNNPCRTEDLEEYQGRVLTVVRAVRYIK